MGGVLPEQIVTTHRNIFPTRVVFGWKDASVAPSNGIHSSSSFVRCVVGTVEVREALELLVVCRDFREYNDDDDTEEDDDDADTDDDEHTDSLPPTLTDASFSLSCNCEGDIILWPFGCNLFDDEWYHWKA